MRIIKIFDIGYRLWYDIKRIWELLYFVHKNDFMKYLTSIKIKIIKSSNICYYFQNLQYRNPNSLILYQLYIILILIFMRYFTNYWRYQISHKRFSHKGIENWYAISNLISKIEPIDIVSIFDSFMRKLNLLWEIDSDFFTR